MKAIESEYMTSAEAARVLGIRQDTVSRLAREGKIPAEKIAKTWLIRRAFIAEMVKNYKGRPGRPRQKRKYTRRIEKEGA